MLSVDCNHNGAYDLRKDVAGRWQIDSSSSLWLINQNKLEKRIRNVPMCFGAIRVVSIASNTQLMWRLTSYDLPSRTSFLFF